MYSPQDPQRQSNQPCQTAPLFNLKPASQVQSKGNDEQKLKWAMWGSFTLVFGLALMMILFRWSLVSRQDQTASQLDSLLSEVSFLNDQNDELSESFNSQEFVFKSVLEDFRTMKEILEASGQDVSSLEGLFDDLDEYLDDELDLASDQILSEDQLNHDHKNILILGNNETTYYAEELNGMLLENFAAEQWEHQMGR